jgi:hypothetical protein
MSKEKRVVVYTEGADDREFLKALKRLPATYEINDANRRKHVQAEGKEGVVAFLAKQIDPKNNIVARALVLLDLDTQSNEEFFDWFESELRKYLPNITISKGIQESRLIEYHVDSQSEKRHIVLIGVGKQHDDKIQSQYGIKQFSLDDWIFHLARIEEVYNAVDNFKPVSYAISMKKYDEVAKVFRDNGLKVEKSKTYLHILRAVTSIGASTTTVVAQLCQKAVSVLPPYRLRAELKDIIEDIELAITILTPPSP